LQVADIDGDNDQDILVTMKDAGDLIWYENDGSQNFTSNTIENNLDGIFEVKVADVDGDGDLDAVATARVADDIVFYTNSDSGYVLDISLSGTPDGAETLTISPTSSSIFDFVGNAASTSQSNNTVTLNDEAAPTITGNSLASDNSTIAVTFSEAVYNTNGGSGSLQVSDFVLSISGGSATLSSTTPSSIAVSSNTYTLGISLSGTVNGSETITVNPASNAIYDASGNVASTSQSNNTASLNTTNYVLDLNGSNEAAYVNDDPAFESTDLSIQVWVDPSSLPSSGNQEWFVNKNRVYRIGLENTGGTTKIIAEFRTGSGDYEDLQGTTLSDASGGWYHVVFTFDDSSNRIRLYVNGNLVASKTHNGSTVNNNSPFSIGRRHDTNAGYYAGKIDEVAYWNTELSANAITALYNSGTPLSASSNSGNYTSSGNLVAYYQFQQNLNDSEGSFTLTGRNISSSDYSAETID
ncbi:MAG: LamG-like jellyroll fold domain-containing protein, partial [Candidatus Neomarinimicrobiota bacterium]